MLDEINVKNGSGRMTRGANKRKQHPGEAGFRDRGPAFRLMDGRLDRREKNDKNANIPAGNRGQM